MNIRQTPLFPGQPSAVPPAYFKSFSIENVKCFTEKTTLHFTNHKGQVARWTVILGENGVGKTTVLQGLAGLCVRADMVKKSENEKTMQPMLSPIMADPNWFFWHDSVQRKNISNKHSFSSEISLGSNLDTLDHITSDTIPWELKLEIERRDQPTFTVTEIAAAPDRMSGLICYPYGAGRRMSKEIRSTQANVNTYLRSLFSDDIALPNIEQWLLELDHASKIEHTQSELSKNKFAQVKSLLTQVLPNIDDIRVAVSPNPTGSAVGLEFKTPYGWVRVRELSFGYQVIASWIVDLTRRLFQRYPDSINPIAEPAIVLIDEIDLHLHPAWQVEVMAHLTKTFQQTQFIVTAHSPLIVQATPDANIILLEREGDHVKVNQNLDMVKNWRVDQILTSDLFKLDSARPPHIAAILKERSEILAKSLLTIEDEVRIKELNQKIHSSPIGETVLEREAEEIIEKAATRLKELGT